MVLPRTQLYAALVRVLYQGGTKVRVQCFCAHSFTPHWCICSTRGKLGEGLFLSTHPYAALVHVQYPGDIRVRMQYFRAHSCKSHWYVCSNRGAPG